MFTIDINEITLKLNIAKEVSEVIGREVSISDVVVSKGGSGVGGLSKKESQKYMKYVNQKFAKLGYSQMSASDRKKNDDFMNNLHNKLQAQRQVETLFSSEYMN